MLLFHEKNLVAQFLTSKITRKMARNRMNENSENCQCEKGPKSLPLLKKGSEVAQCSWKKKFTNSSN